MFVCRGKAIIKCVCVCVCVCVRVRVRVRVSGSLTYSEVGCCQGVGGVAVLTDDGGGVSQLTVVVTSSSDAG